MTLSSRRKALRESVKENIRRAGHSDDEDVELEQSKNVLSGEDETTTNATNTLNLNRKKINYEDEDLSGEDNDYAPEEDEEDEEFEDDEGGGDEEGDYSGKGVRKSSKRKLVEDEEYDPSLPPKQTRTIFKSIDDPSSTVCEKCGMEFRNVIDKRNHRRTHSQPKKHECTICGKKFSQKANLEIHTTHVHHDLILEDIDVKKEEENNDANLFAQSDILKAVPSNFNLKEVRVFHCQALKCGKGFISYDKLMRHLKQDHEGEEIQHEEPPASSQQQIDQKQHLQQLQQQQLHQQQLQQQQLQQQQQQQQQLKVMEEFNRPIIPPSIAHEPYDHSPDTAAVAVKKARARLEATKPKKEPLPKIHQCSHPGCSKSFAKVSDLTRHYRIHTGERPYVCEHCGASFNQRYRLTTHVRIHTGEKPFHCKYCGKNFARGDAVQSHIFSIHRDKGAAF